MSTSRYDFIEQFLEDPKRWAKQYSVQAHKGKGLTVSKCKRHETSYLNRNWIDVEVQACRNCSKENLGKCLFSVMAVSSNLIPEKNCSVGG